MHRSPPAAPLALATLASLLALHPVLSHAQTSAPSATPAPTTASRTTNVDPSPRQLERVTIQGEASTEALQGSAGSTSRLELSLKETPASVTVVDRDSIEARGASNTQEILKSVPGVVFAAPPARPARCITAALARARCPSSTTASACNTTPSPRARWTVGSWIGWRPSAARPAF